MIWTQVCDAAASRAGGGAGRCCGGRGSRGGVVGGVWVSGPRPPSPPTPPLLTAGCPTVISVVAHRVSGALTFYCLHRHNRSTHAHTRARTETGFPRRLVILTGKLRTHSKQISLFLFNGSLRRLPRKSPNSRQ